MDFRINQALKFMNENLNKKLTLQDTAQMLNLSATYFSDLFKKELGIGFSKYRTQLRIKEATALLKDRSSQIKQISYEVGYRNVSNFNHDFKKLVGLSPRQYKTQSRG